jgi:hypothetical protein
VLLRIPFKPGWHLAVLAFVVSVHPALAQFTCGTYHKKPCCPPYCAPCFGYNPPQWRPWPLECSPCHGAVIGPAPDSLPPPRKTPDEEPDSRELVPPPKPDDSRLHPSNPLRPAAAFNAAPAAQIVPSTTPYPVYQWTPAQASQKPVELPSWRQEQSPSKGVGYLDGVGPH